MTKKNIWVVALLLALTFVFFSCGEEFDYNIGETFYEGPPFEWGDVAADGLKPSKIIGPGAAFSYDDDEQIIRIDRTAGGPGGMVLWFEDYGIKSFDQDTQKIEIEFLVIVDGGTAQLTLKQPKTAYANKAAMTADTDGNPWDSGDANDLWYSPGFFCEDAFDTITISLNGRERHAGSNLVSDKFFMFQFNDWQNSNMKFEMRIIRIEAVDN